MQRPMAKEVLGFMNEVPSTCGNRWRGESDAPRNVHRDLTQEPVDGRRVSTGPAHRALVEFKVREVALARNFVRFFIKDDFIDEAPGLWVWSGQPGHLNARKPPL